MVLLRTVRWFWPSAECCLYIKFMQGAIKWLMGFDCQINMLWHFRRTPNRRTSPTTGLECLIEGGLQRCFFSSSLRGRIIYLRNEISFLTQSWLSSQNLVLSLNNLKFEHPKPTINAPTKYIVSHALEQSCGEHSKTWTPSTRSHLQVVIQCHLVTRPSRHICKKALLVRHRLFHKV